MLSNFILLIISLSLSFLISLSPRRRRLINQKFREKLQNEFPAAKKWFLANFFGVA